MGPHGISGNPEFIVYRDKFDDAVALSAEAIRKNASGNGRFETLECLIGTEFEFKLARWWAFKEEVRALGGNLGEMQAAIETALQSSPWNVNRDDRNFDWTERSRIVHSIEAEFFKTKLALESALGEEAGVEDYMALADSMMAPVFEAAKVDDVPRLQAMLKTRILNWRMESMPVQEMSLGM
jgi:hypothetical protein